MPLQAISTSGYIAIKTCKKWLSRLYKTLKLTFGSNCKNAVSSQPIFLHFQISKYYVTRLETIPGSEQGKVFK